jgi:hypothetical protein
MEKLYLRFLLKSGSLKGAASSVKSQNKILQPADQTQKETFLHHSGK